jgi:hypothetical protein
MTNNNNIYFSPDITDRERACFETGIKLGALYHIICGIPISKDENIISSIEKGIEAALSCQPFVKSVKITINREKIIGDKSTPFNYDEITGKIIKAELILHYNDVEVLAKINWVEELQYPLMYIEEIRQKD